VSSLPDYKSTFPQWSRKDVGEAVPQLDASGLDLLKQLLTYDTAKRISGWFRLVCRSSGVYDLRALLAKRALIHQYFEGLMTY
jgi:cyclin-dependent kinase